MKKLILAISILSAGLAASASSLELNDRGSIDSYRRSCSAELCSYDLSWQVRGNSSVVILEVIGGPEHGTVKLLGCSSSTGRSDIPWIRRDGAQYVFHLFDSSRCTRDVFRFERPVDSVVIQERANGGGGGRYGQIEGQRRRCYSDLCEYDINWNVDGNASVVTVVDAQTGREKLFACAASSGQQAANWIPRNGTRVEFRLYASNVCSEDVSRRARAVDTLIIRER